MTTTTSTAALARPNGAGSGERSAVRLTAGTPATVVPISRGTGARARTIGVVLLDPTGARWQRTADVERLLTLATVAGSLAAAVGCVAAAVRRPTARVDRLTMGPGGWVSFKGGEQPRPRGIRRAGLSSPRAPLRPCPRPWWAVALRARPLDR